ncbi:MAG: BadF/BadG/BcrA/BcrD ATPase family protein [Chloroflexota bacterium]|nr:BadF/BadG/BcrA/BcrD ATPase family protein [Chloroflexota bacterium]
MIILGIDGGGSNLRVAAVEMGDPTRPFIVAQATRGAANPGAIGREAAAALIHDAIGELRASVKQPIAAVGIGVAGANPLYADDWLRATIASALPVPAATATDIEIALVGAHGMRRGAIVVAGTGSVALAIADDGRSAQVGGWGYLLGDEGGGYWIGLEALRLVTRWADAPTAEHQFMAQAIVKQIGVTRPHELIAWTYRGGAPDVRAIAALASGVIDLANAGVPLARSIIQRAADHLTRLVRQAKARIDVAALPIAFGGGLLMSDNPLSQELVYSLELSDRPESKYPPVVGAAILARALIAL